MPRNPPPPVDSKTVRRVKKNVKIKKKTPEPRGITSEGRPRKRPKGMSPERLAKVPQALELRMAGTSYAQIAKALELPDASVAKRLVDKGTSGVIVDAAKEVITMDLARIDEMQMRSMHALRTNGDLNQIHTVLRLMEWRYKLLGISDETVRALQSEHGVTTNITNNKNQVMVVQAAPETEEQFIAKMMRAVGVDPDSKEAKEYIKQHQSDEARTLPMLAGSANDSKNANAAAQQLEDEEIVDAEIVE